MKFDSKDLLSSLVLLGLLLIFNSEVVFFQKYFALSDVTDFSFTLRFDLAQAIRHRTIPLWISLPKFGHPVFTDFNAGMFYPFNFFFLLPNTLKVFRNIILGHFFMAAWFMYLWIRRLEVRHLSALIGAIIFCFSAILISWHQNLYFLEGCVWLPLILLLFHYAARRGDFRLALICGFIMAVQFLSGALPFFLGSLCFLAAWSLLTYRQALLRRRAGKLGLIALGVCICSTLYLTLPLGELLLANFHGASVNIQLLTGQNDFSLWKIIGFVLPPWHSLAQGLEGTYVGILALFLSLCAILLKKGCALKDEIETLVWLGSLSLIVLALGFLTHLHRIFDFETVAFFAVFSLACLAGLGFDRLLSVCADWEQSINQVLTQRLKKVLWGILIAAGVCWCAVFLGLANKTRITELLRTFAPAGHSAEDFSNLLHSILFALALVTAVPILLLKRLGIRGEEKFFATLVLILVTWELFQVNDSLLRLQSADDLLQGLSVSNPVAGVTEENLVLVPVGQPNAVAEEKYVPDLNENPNAWEFDVQARKKLLVVLKQNSVPGWRVRVDGIRNNLIETDQHWLGVIIPPGLHRVRFVYQPFFYILGKYLSFAFLTGLAVYLLHPFSLKTLIRTFSLGGLERHP